MSPAQDNPSQLRALFDAVCELPPAQWRQRLEILTDDRAAIEEVIALLQAQTISFNRALAPLGQLMASLPETELQVGDHLGQWQLVEQLASGGMGTVFVAERADQLFRQRVAIKLLRGIATDPDVGKRLAEERQILAELEHPGIARLFDGGTTPAGHPYLVMEYIPGLPLNAHCLQQGFGLNARVRQILRVCMAVQAAHQRLVIHCDIKPSNILMRDDDAPVLLDFGIAQVLGHGSGDPLAFCTPAYASPEQLNGAKLDVTSDVFSLGVLLTELVACRSAGRSVASRDMPVPLPSALAGDDCAWRGKLRGDLDAVAAKACALSPSARYASVQDFAADLKAWLDRRPVLAVNGGFAYRARHFLRRHALATSMAALAVVALVAGLGVALWQGQQARLQRDRAEREAVIARQVGDFLVAAFDAADPRLLGAKGADQVTARQVLDNAAAKIDETAIDDPAVLARLRHVLGRSYANLGQSERAEALLQQAVKGFMAANVERPDQAVQAWIELAALQSDQRRGAEAVVLTQRALALAQGVGDPALIASAQNAMGSALRVEGRFEEAQRALDTALAMCTSLFGAHASKTLDVRHNLAVLYAERGDSALAERMYRDVVGHLPSKRSWDYQLSLAGLAATIRKQGRYVEAAQLLRDNLSLARELYGDNSDRYAKANTDLAMAYRDAGEYALARAHYREAVEIDRRLNREEGASLAIRLNGLASIEEARGDLDAAERTYRQSLAIRRRLFPAGDNSVLIAQANLGHVLTLMERREEARPLLREALDLWRQRQHPNAVPGALNWVEWLLDAGQLDAAAAELRAIPAPDADKAGDHQQYLAAQATLATKRHNTKDAEALWRQLVALSTDQAGADAVPTAKWRVPHAELLLAGGDPAAAREQLRIAEPVLRKALVANAALLQRIDALQRALAATPVSD